MGNLNTYGLPQMKRIMGVTGNGSDATYLSFCQQAVYEADAKIVAGMSVAIEGSSYTLSPDPGSTSALWNVIARGAVLLYYENELHAFLKEMEGIASIRDEVTTMNRSATMRALNSSVERHAKAYKGALSGYRKTATDSVVGMEELGLRESAVTEEATA